MAPIAKNGSLSRYTAAKGMIPIEKNIIVVDERGTRYEATYLKRAKGLVKKGRARFLSENMICLACPPNHMEDNIMTDTYTSETSKSAELSVSYILSRLEAIQQDTDYLHEAIATLTQMSDGNTPHTPGDIAGQAKAEAIGQIVCCRETTNQQMIQLYHRMYEDLSPNPQSFNPLEFMKASNHMQGPQNCWTSGGFDDAMKFMHGMRNAWSSDHSANPTD